MLPLGAIQAASGRVMIRFPAAARERITLFNKFRDAMADMLQGMDPAEFAEVMAIQPPPKVSSVKELLPGVMAELRAKREQQREARSQEGAA